MILWPGPKKFEERNGKDVQLYSLDKIYKKSADNFELSADTPYSCLQITGNTPSYQSI